MNDVGYPQLVRCEITLDEDTGDITISPTWRVKDFESKYLHTQHELIPAADVESVDMVQFFRNRYDDAKTAFFDRDLLTPTELTGERHGFNPVEEV